MAACGSNSTRTNDVTGDGDVNAGGDGGDLAILGQPTGDIDSTHLGGTPQPTIAYLTQTYGDRVLFDYDSAMLTPEGQDIVKGWAQWMRQFPDLAVRIEGHSDERGTREYNLALGDRRASAVRELLVALGINPARIAVVSYGKERPVVAGHDQESWAQNRRGVLSII